MIDLQDPVCAVSDILFGDVIHLVAQQHCRCQALSRISQPAGLPQYLERQAVLEKIAVISEYPDLKIIRHGTSLIYQIFFS